MIHYNLKDFFTIMNLSQPYLFSEQFYSNLRTIDENVTPIITEKQDIHRKVEYTKRSNYSKKPTSIISTSTQNWEDVRSSFKPTTIEKSREEGIDKWMQDIRISINKISTKNYDIQVINIIESLKKCVEMENQDETQRNNNLKTIANFIFTIASTNKFYAELYANLYEELIKSYTIFQDILQTFLSIY